MLLSFKTIYLKHETNTATGKSWNLIRSVRGGNVATRNLTRSDS